MKIIKSLFKKLGYIPVSERVNVLKELDRGSVYEYTHEVKIINPNSKNISDTLGISDQRFHALNQMLYDATRSSVVMRQCDCGKDHKVPGADWSLVVSKVSKQLTHQNELAMCCHMASRVIDRVLQTEMSNSGGHDIGDMLSRIFGPR